MMVKFGKLVPTEHQTCYTHGMHLPVQEVLYEKPSQQIQQNSFEETSDDDEVSSDESESDTEVSFLGAAMDKNIPIPKVKVHLQSVITKVRKIVKLFRKSPVKNDVLQEEIKTKHGKEVSLILDCRTRSNSLLSMIQQFLKVKHSIRKVLKDISPHLICSDDEEDILSDIVAALEPVKLAAEALCRQNATLLTAEGIFKFLVNRLKQQDSPLCIAMKSAILRRLEERRQSNLVSLYRYLSNPECLSDIEEHKVFNMPPKSLLQKTSKPKTCCLGFFQQIQMTWSLFKTCMAQKLLTKIHFLLKRNSRKQFSIRQKNSDTIQTTNSRPFQKKCWSMKRPERELQTLNFCSMH
ncbi:uncharacterized protein LOC136079950 [Hydra vulgaris]|uniref:Uncharacterized protein LOC136079950 n=1 Tax=Hydra vulgaris TaxID=6087 RepID=A0ABM4BU53_HYDVU